MDLLPDDMLTNILARLPPCSLAASRCVRKRWCAIIDAQRLLRADLLPLLLDGFFFLAEDLGLDFSRTYFFSRPSTGRRISGHLNYLFDDPWILDHCNGLLLLWERVFNPATRQSVTLPPFPELPSSYERYLLAYDPFVSPQHYEVLIIPGIDSKEGSAEWPQSPFTMHVFSSRKWRWEQRSFVREENRADAETTADMMRSVDCWGEDQLRHAVYWRGALYVHSQNDSIMRITLSNNKYQMIKSPAENHGVAYIGKSQKGLYCASFSDENRFQVWLLDESCGERKWVLKSDINLQVMVETFPIDYTDRYVTPWIVNYEKDVSEACTEDELEWDFESGVVLHEAQDKITTCFKKCIFLGFHPYKEIAFFYIPFSRVVSYHLSSSKVQELGTLNKAIVKSFPYTPCWMGKLFENNSSSN